MKIVRFVFIVLGIVLTINIYAQPSAYKSENNHLNKAIDLYEKEMYRSAQEELQKAYKYCAPNDYLKKSTIDFYNSMCALQTKQPNAQELAESLLSITPKITNFSLGAYEYSKYLFDDEKYKEAKNWFAQVDINDIPIKKHTEFLFKSGYCYYRSGDANDKKTALNLFRQAKEQRNLFGDAATYYYSHIEYENGNYATASKGFERLRNNPNYSSVVPYYSMQIAFIQKDYDKVISEGVEFINYSSDKRKDEIARLISEAYLYKGDVEKSLSYFNEYERNNEKLTREDKYLKAYILYKNEKYNDAIGVFKGLESRNDSISQMRNYYLGDSYLKTNSKPEALKTFMEASKTAFDKDITENAMFNYAKLSIELNNDEKPVNTYLEKYPNNYKSDELKTFLAENEAKKGNYVEALNILQSIKNPLPSEKEAIQSISYVYGLELLKQDKFGEAIKMFDFSMKHSTINNSIAVLCRYWKAEALYNQGNYNLAEKQYEDFISISGAFKNLQEYKLAHYNVAYCYFKQKQYDMAINWFQKYINLEIKTRKTLYLGDSYNRIGDCYFKKREFQKAIDNYTKAESLNLFNPDYSAYQRALTLGFTSSNDSKIKALQRVINNYPESDYVPAALYEMGRTYTQLSNYNEAAKAYQQIIINYKLSNYYPKALVEMGLIQVNENNPEKALAYYQQVVEKSPDAPESKDALEGIKNIYVDQNRMDEYFAYVNRIGQTIKGTSEKDSLVFNAAEKQYQSGDCDKALPALKRYLNDYSDAINKTAANFYIADCSLRKGDNSEAAKAYSYVINQPQNDFTEMAWFGYAKANLMLENYLKAIEGFEKLKKISQTPSIQLDAEVGCMRAYFATEKYDKSLSSATKIAATKNIPSELIEEANYIRARSLQQIGKLNDAMEIYKKIAKNYSKSNDAEAKFRIIEILYNTKKYKEAESEVYSFSENKSANQYWLAKAFIVLGDVYVQQKDFFQAKATYKSIVDGYPNKNDSILEEASNRYSEIENKN